MKKIIFCILTVLSFESIQAADVKVQTCKYQWDAKQEETLILKEYSLGTATLQLGELSPFGIIHLVEMKLTSAQVDKCDISQNNDEKFEKCIVSTFRTTNDYQKELPILFAFMRAKEKLNELTLSFDTSLVASAKSFYYQEINPASGSSEFVQFFNNKQQLIGQILMPGLGAVLDCKISK